MRVRLIAEWACAALGLALIASLWFEWEPGDGGEGGFYVETGWETLVLGDLALCAAGVTGVALWLVKDEARRSGPLASIAPAITVGAVFVVLDAVVDGRPSGAAYVALGCAAGLALACIVATGFLRARPRDWRLDAAAASVLACMWMPWMTEPFFSWSFLSLLYGDGLENGWEWFEEVDLFVGLAVAAALAASHARGPLGDRGIAARAAAVAAVAVPVSLGRALAVADDNGWDLQLQYGAYPGVASLLLLLAVALRRPGPGPAPTRRGP